MANEAPERKTPERILVSGFVWYDINDHHHHLRPNATEYIRADLATPPAVKVTADEHMLADEMLEELVLARTKFPGRNVTFAALVEEVGELATATFEESRARVRKEAVQVAVMAMRMVLDGDHTFDTWRASKGLDALTAAQESG